MRALLLLSTIFMVSNQADAAPRRPARAAPPLVVSQVNGEPVLRFGTDVITRPFGATLVDRVDVVGSYALPDGRAFLVRGTTTAPCPVHYLIVQAQGGLPRPSAPFGTCADGARARLSRGILRVTVPSGSLEVPSAVFAYSGGRITPVAVPTPGPSTMTSGSAALPAPDPIAAWAGQSGCPSVSRAAAVGASEQLMTSFDQHYPADWRRRGRLEKVVLEPDELRRVVTGLACLSTWPAADPAVPRAAVPLFASKRHGRLAFELLDGVARDAIVPSDVRAAARSFHAEMRFRVDRREPI